MPVLTMTPQMETTMARSRLLTSAALALVFLTTACGGNPEEKSAAALKEAYEAWTEASKDDRLDRRLRNYEKSLKAAERVLERYSETEAGERLARYGASGGVDLNAWREARAELQAKLPCINAPDAACLSEFAVQPLRDTTEPRHRNPEIQPAVTAACAGKSAVALSALSKYQANGQAYRANLVQTAMMAADCGEDGVVADLVTVAVDSDNAAGQLRVQNLAQIMATPRLRPGWGMAADAMVAHVDAGGLPEQDMANGLAAAMDGYAGAGQPERALAMYRRVAEDMGYQVQFNNTVPQLLAHNGAQVALGEPFRRQTLGDYNTSAFENALKIIMADAGLTGTSRFERASGRFESSLQFDFRSDPSDLLTPITDGPARNALKVRLEDFRKAMDAAIQDGQNNPVSSLSFGDAQYLIALIYLRLGEPETAAAVVEAAGEIPPPPRYGASYTPHYDVAYWMAVGELDKALEVATRSASDLYERLAQEFGQAGRASDAQGVIGQLLNLTGPGRASELNLAFAEGLIEAGQAADAIAMVVSLRSEYRNSRNSDRVFLALVRALSAQGNLAALDSLDVPGTVGARSEDKIAFLGARAAGLIEAGETEAAQEALEALYAYAETAEPSERDPLADIRRATGRTGPNRGFIMEPARIALEGGLVDIGLDYYERAGRWDSAPLVAAARQATSASERSKLLAAAFDTSQNAFGATAWGALQSLGGK